MAARLRAVQTRVSSAHPCQALRPLASVACCAGTAHRLPWLAVLPPALPPEPDVPGASWVSVPASGQRDGSNRCTFITLCETRCSPIFGNCVQMVLSPSPVRLHVKQHRTQSTQAVSRRRLCLKVTMLLRQRGACPLHPSVLYGEIRHLHLHLSHAHLPPRPAATWALCVCCFARCACTSRSNLRALAVHRAAWRQQQQTPLGTSAVCHACL